MEAELLALSIPFALIAGTVVMVIYLRRYQNEERMAMIERGVSPELFHQPPRHAASGALRIALLLIGGGLGLLMGYFLDQAFYMEEVGYFSMLFIFGGIGLGVAYLIEEKKNRKLGSSNP